MQNLLHNISAILTLRWKQTYRMLLQLGVIRLLLLLALFVFALLYVWSVMVQDRKSYWVVSAWLAVIFFVNYNRRDRIFLALNMSRYQVVICVEYFLLSLPLIVCLFFNCQWLPFLFCLFGIVGIAFFEIIKKHRKKTLNTRFQQFIPSDMYEWKAGIRKYFYTILIVWTLGFCCSFFVAVVPVALFIIGLLMVDFYQANESWQMLLSYQMTPSKLLFYKMKKHVQIYICI